MSAERTRRGNLAYPRFIDHAVPGTECGKCPDDVQDDLQQYCEQIRVRVHGWFWHPRADEHPWIVLHP